MFRNCFHPRTQANIQDTGRCSGHGPVFRTRAGVQDTGQCSGHGPVFRTQFLETPLTVEETNKEPRDYCHGKVDAETKDQSGDSHTDTADDDHRFPPLAVCNHTPDVAGWEERCSFPTLRLNRDCKLAEGGFCCSLYKWPLMNRTVVRSY